MKHKHKFQFARFINYSYQNPYRHERTSEFICECGKIKEVKLK